MNEAFYYIYNMEEKELIPFIEELVKTLPDERIFLRDEIKEFDVSKIEYHELIRNNLIKLKLLTATNDIYDELTEHGVDLKNGIIIKQHVIDELNKLKRGEKFSIHKSLDVDYKEQSEVMHRLFNLKLLSKGKNSYIVGDIKGLSKLIKLKSIEKYLEWIEDNDLSHNNSTTNIYNNQNNDFKNSNISQLNQNSDLSNSDIKMKQVNNSEVKKTDVKPVASFFLKYLWPIIVTVIGGVIVVVLTT